MNYRKAYMDKYAEAYESMYGINIRSMDVHHIDHDRDNNDPNNLVALPRELHSRYHKNHADMKRFGFQIPNKMCGAGVGHDSYLLGICIEYLADLVDCQEWIKTRDMVKMFGLNEVVK